MKKERKEKVLKILSLITGMVFLMGSINSFSSQQLLFGIVELIAGGFNIFAAINRKKTVFRKRVIKYGIGLLNIIVPIFIAINYIQRGTQYIQYVWMLVVFMSSIALFIQIRKDKRTWATEWNPTK